ncbi:MAG: hypothetical protein ABJM65_05950, partial [Ascidiaceihabitans sp.]|uniref:hypothetical protein n=1 Tax=Ascidiaceihabitans sp. TaxID=1872644 RepID=UPI00329A7410
KIYAQVFSDHGLDAIVFPTTPLTARPIGQDETVELNGAQVPTFPTYKSLDRSLIASVTR